MVEEADDVVCFRETPSAFPCWPGAWGASRRAPSLGEAWPQEALRSIAVGAGGLAVFVELAERGRIKMPISQKYRLGQAAEVLKALVSP
ncbi:hypothetical protein [Pyrobaculum sp.]|uniref:hypothetical protein n=1 Tax=Pyrobaculum sp. TaxID=2004705 RepID=UPI0031702C46